jgi:nitroimidazol reductase NimA-like FMN-containing flavoprotein (pyridoxamine 5'-phosphate oxidase superfamily)
MKRTPKPLTTAPSKRTTVHRASERGHHDRAIVHAIVDAAWLCHVAFTDLHTDTGEPYPVSLPTACWRIGDQVFIHGSNGSRMMKRLASGAPVCLSVTLLDGMVLARSAFSHSMNYRSVVVFGQFEVVPEADKPAVLDAFIDHIAPGRRLEARPGDVNELKATTVLALSLAEASAKIRAWGPHDKEGDESLPVWAGVLPLREQRLAPVPDARTAEQGRPLPEYLSAWLQAQPAAPAMNKD